MTERPLNLAVLCHPAYGGSGVVATELGLALARRGHRVHFVSHAIPFRLQGGEPGIVLHQVDVTTYPVFKYPPYGLALAGRLVELAREEPIDLFHAHYAIPHAVSAVLACDILGPHAPKIITTLHGTDITLIGIDRSFQSVTQHALQRSDGITAVSRHLAEETRQSFPVDRPIRVIHNFIQLDTFHPARRSLELRRRYAADDELLLGHLSNFRPVKRAHDVIRAFHLLHQSVKARLLMVGDGVELESIKGLTAELGIASHVEFLGAVDRVADILAQLDLFLLPSEYESFGLAALEAMACGVPVICTRTGGTPEVVEDGVSGVLCDVGDFRCIAGLALALLKDPARREAMGKAARARAAEAFPEDRIVARYEQLYREVLEGRGEGPP